MHDFKAVNPETGRYDNITAQLILTEAYDIEYGLYDHDNPELEHPFQSQLMFEQEKILDHSPMMRLYETYSLYQIQKWFGISLLEFINMPAVRFDQLIKLSNKLAEEENERLTNAEKQMQNMQNQINKQVDGFRNEMGQPNQSAINRFSDY